MKQQTVIYHVVIAIRPSRNSKQHVDIRKTHLAAAQQITGPDHSLIRYAAEETHTCYVTLSY